MPAFLTISVGPSADEAKPVLASADQAAVAAAFEAMWTRIKPVPSEDFGAAHEQCSERQDRPFAVPGSWKR